MSTDRRAGPARRRRPPRRGAVAAWAAIAAVGLLACGPAAQPPAAPARAAEGPFVRVLGTAQDGGLPHAGCACDRCEAARHDPGLRRRVASLAVVLPASGRVYLVDATPDLREQLDALADVRRPPPGRVDRSPVDGILLTHAHMGHYLGLVFLGREAIASDGLPVWATPRMGDFLAGSGPWSQLLSLGNVELRGLAPGEAVDLGDGVTATAVPVPHREEYSDTVGFRLRGPRATLLYVPDTDSWEAWGGALDGALAGVDVALVDGTFHSADELPGRALAEIPHPMIADSVHRFAPAVAAGRLRVLFTHLNHSNPALDRDGPERRALEAAGFAVLEEGQELPL